MLDYLRDEKTRTETPEASQAGADPQQLLPGDDYITPAVHEKRVQQSTIMLVVLFAAGLGALWFMVKKSGPAAASAVVQQEDKLIEQAIAKVTGTKAEFFKGIDSVVSKFNEFSKVKQVGVDELQKNPFEHLEYGKFQNTSVTSEESRAESAATKERTEHEGLARAAKGLQLQGIMQSPQGNCCMIDDKILYKGNMIKNWKIESITDTSVELIADGIRNVLTISSGDDDVQSKK